MPVPRAVVAAVVATSALPVTTGSPQAGGGYCALPDDSQVSPPNLIATASSLGWIHPNPPPARREPSDLERLDFAGFPNVSVLDVAGPDGRTAQKVITTFTTNVDKVVTLTSEAAVSTDGGVTFGPSAATPLRESPIELLDGSYFATEYYQKRTGPHTARLGVLTSDAADDGEDWLRSAATLRTPDELLSGGAAHGTPAQLADGTILITVYARYRDTGAYQAEVYASADGGRTFERRGVIARPEEAGYAYTEAALAQVMDGSLLAVIRRDGGTYATLSQTRSTDGGRTWTPPAGLRFAGTDCVVRGVAPRLLLMPGGTLVLSAGRPDNWLAVSRDGLGQEWQQPRVTYHNRDGVWDAHGSSGYTGVAALGPHRLIQVFDNCKIAGVRPDHSLDETACPAHGRFEQGGWYAIKRGLYDVAPPAPGRLDLAGLLRRGDLKIATTMRWTGRGRPHTRPEAALDGSTGYWSSAVAAGGPGEYVLHLDRQYRFTMAGLSLRPGHPAGARVYVSRDGRAWGKPVLTIHHRTDYALRHDAIVAKGRHVKIVVDRSNDCDREIGPSCAMLNEIELYAAT
ncbi:sialidase family protein [Nonomuraea bangladeshensis]|uniref:sialidase family protein n=1 Tax=Nonomuraea bangladeshensis TaxID=404385 RepID=UPI003C2D4F72